MLSIHDIGEFRRRRRGKRTYTEKLWRIPFCSLAHYSPKTAVFATKIPQECLHMLLKYDCSDFRGRRSGNAQKRKKTGQIPLRKMAHTGPKKAKFSTTLRQICIYMLTYVYYTSTASYWKQKNTQNRSQSCGTGKTRKSKKNLFANIPGDTLGDKIPTKIVRGYNTRGI